ncbi:tRNA(m5U54)methyltransferase [Ceratobasidium sp. 414]|nr:tRNA(m5U54)methyltransferase [Ceratobasidium sp. 414]
MASVRGSSPLGASPPPLKRARLEEPVGATEGAKENSTHEPKAKGKPKKSRGKRQNIEPYSSDDVLWHDVKAALGSEAVDAAVREGRDWDSPLPFGLELEVTVSEITSTGEKIRTKIYRSSRLHSFGDLVEVLDPNNKLRDNSLIRCKYFGKCAGCQHQMIPYETQLLMKKEIVRKAFQNFSGKSKDADASWELRIGFNQMGRRSVLDIEECPIATPVLNAALGPAREQVHSNIQTYKRGATLLLRDSLEPRSASSGGEDGAALSSETYIANHSDNDGTPHVCITDSKSVVHERVGDFEFTFPAGQFFQNNNSVLKPLTEYVRDAILRPAQSGGAEAQNAHPPTHLVDTYCGSGLFSITLSPHFDVIAGIEISADSIAFAQRNAALNSIPTSKCTFRAGTASSIFASVGEFPPDRTAVVIDPPRKGCDEPFIEQLVAFRPATLVYVSCNVHTQARDMGSIVQKTQEAEVGRRYQIESIRGFDLFPQTAHVESVAVLRLY